VIFACVKETEPAPMLLHHCETEYLIQFYEKETNRGELEIPAPDAIGFSWFVI